MLSEAHFEELSRQGFTVVEDVLNAGECDAAIIQYRAWLSQFRTGEWPHSTHSLIQRYNTGHMQPTWYVRMKSKKVFAQLWNTDKLLSSFDAIAIGRPPEDGVEEFHVPGTHWLHVDQSAARVGLHAYQGAVYLEEAAEDDWTLLVLQGSHLLLEDFYNNNPRARIRSITNNFYSFLKEEIVAMKQKGCIEKRVPVPKGGMVLWDSRLIHANTRPVQGRKHTGRWRFCVFVSMTPAIWATTNDFRDKQEAYESISMTTHWSSQGIRFFNTHIPSYTKQDVEYPKELPDIAKTREAKLISGVIRFDFTDGKPNGNEFRPQWFKPRARFTFDGAAKIVGCTAAVLTSTLVALLVYRGRRQ